MAQILVVDDEMGIRELLSEILTDDLARFLSPVDDAAALGANIREALESYPPITEQHIERFRAENTIRTYIAHLAMLAEKGRL